MKKIVGIIAAAAFAASAFAEVNIGTWNRGVFSPLHYDGDTLRSLEGPSWEVGDKGGIRTGLGFSASSENAGMVFDIHGNPGVAIAMGDNAYTWVKPVDMLTLKFGKMDNNWGRLDHCFGTWNYARFANGLSTGEGFAGVERQKGCGAQVTLQPVEGLVIDYEANFGKDNHTYAVMWENSSTMIGYKADFGFIRAIINGQPAASYEFGEDTKPAAIIGLAADITAVENLALKIGASIPTNLTGFVMKDKNDKVTTNGKDCVKIESNKIQVGVGADYTLDALALHANATVHIMAKKAKDDGKQVELGAFGVTAGAGVDYAFSDMFKLVTDVRFASWTTSSMDKADIKYEDPAFGAYIGLEQALTNAQFAFGAQFGKRAMSPAAKADDFTFAIPLTMTVSF